MSYSRLLLFCVSFLATAAFVSQCLAQPIVDPKKAGPDYAITGEYVTDDAPLGTPKALSAQVVMYGDNYFQAKIRRGGLPGAGFKRGDPFVSFAGRPGNGDGELPMEKTERAIEERRNLVADQPVKIRDGVVYVTDHDGTVRSLKRIERTSPTLGKKPPKDAIVLFDGSNTDSWEEAKMSADGLLEVGTQSKQHFRDFFLHIEFRTPLIHYGRNQGRGNSGVYLQNRYEIQILDSFGLEGLDNECGAIYGFFPPLHHMCLRPLAWQTYDIDFTAARFNEKGEKTQNAVVTVDQNGVVIHDKQELKNVTFGGELKEFPGEGPIMLQHHGNPVHFRNIWIVPHGEQPEFNPPQVRSQPLSFDSKTRLEKDADVADAR